jgi:hypothetical protein
MNRNELLNTVGFTQNERYMSSTSVAFDAGSVPLTSGATPIGTSAGGNTGSP